MHKRSIFVNLSSKTFLINSLLRDEMYQWSYFYLLKKIKQQQQKNISLFMPSKNHKFAICNQWHVVLGRLDIRHKSFLSINILLCKMFMAAKVIF